MLAHHNPKSSVMEPQTLIPQPLPTWRLQVIPFFFLFLSFSLARSFAFSTVSWWHVTHIHFQPSFANNFRAYSYGTLHDGLNLSCTGCISIYSVLCMQRTVFELHGYVLHLIPAKINIIGLVRWCAAMAGSFLLTHIRSVSFLESIVSLV